MTTTITLAIVAAIGIFTLALFVVPGLSASMFFGLARGFFTVFAENRKERVAERRKNGLLGRRRRKTQPEEQADRKLEETSTIVLDSDTNVLHTVSVEGNEVLPGQHIRDRIRERREQRRSRRRN